MEGTFDFDTTSFNFGVPNTQNGGPSSNAANNAAYGRTPPQFTPSSYEASHFGKRARAGSISGRLRSASDLEDKGLITRSQKGLIKDLIISADPVLQSALDNYDAGNTQELETMIREGRLDHKSSVDLLEDLDLDFLSVSMGSSSQLKAGMHIKNASAAKQGAQDDTDNIVTPSSTGQGAEQLANHVNQGSSKGGFEDFNDPLFSGGDDGIGDLNFNDLDYTGGGGGQTTPSSEMYGAGGSSSKHRTNSLGMSLTDHDGPLHSANNGPGGGGNNSSVHGYGTRRTSHRETAALASANRRRSNSLSQSLDNTRPGSHFSTSLFGSVNNAAGTPGGRGSSLMKDGSFLNMDFKDGSFGAGWMDGLAAVPTGSVGSGIDGMGGPSGLGSMLYGAGGQGGDDMILNGGVMMPNEGEMVYADSGQYPGYANAYNQYEPRLGRKPKGKPKGKPKNSPKGKIHRKKGMEDYIGGQGRPRSMSDPNITMEEEYEPPERPEGWIGAYSPESRKLRIERFLEKRNHRVWTKKVKYDVRKNFADSRMRVKGRFVKKEDEVLMRELMSLT
ncbi:hypothetical protein TrCOL_g13629 [Triparma columacea]|uniref:CCT domain-containing protein n=1 Tax=Triparma columacea TaxID=722753 RepID=A0A9W7FX40_9STRA|nr:hypothetical protein TrCOL_g13629 [Triparma columacea]